MEEGDGLGDYAGLVAKAVLEETMAERIWSIPCSADCHSHHISSTLQPGGGRTQRNGGGALCWTPESSCTDLLQKPDFQAHCREYRESRKSPHPAATPEPPVGAERSAPDPTAHAASGGDHAAGEPVTPADPQNRPHSGCRTETDVVHYRLSGYSRDSLHLPERWGEVRVRGESPVSPRVEEEEEEVVQQQSSHAQALRNKSVENLSSTPHLHTNGSRPSLLRKGLSVNDITRVSPSVTYHHTGGINGDTNGHLTPAVPAVTSHKSPSRLQFLRHLGLRKTNRDEVTGRSVAPLPTADSASSNSPVKGEDGGGQRKGGGGASSLRKTITNIFHLKPSVKNHGGTCGTEESGESRRKINGGGGGLISRFTARRQKTVPPGKRALPPVPPSSSSHGVSPSRTPSPQLLTPAAAERVPSPGNANLGASDWPEGGGVWPPAGLAADHSPELAVVSSSGAASPAAVQSQTDFAGSIEKVKDHGWYWGPLSGEAAERILAKEPDGSFVVRDSSDDHYIFSLTFKLNGFVRHVRIEHDQGNFSFGSCTKFKSHTIVDFIENAVEHSRSGRFLFFLHRRPVLGPMRVQLLHPVSRFKRVQSLQHLCRYVIVKHVRKDHLEELPVPNRIKTYLNTPFYYSEQIEAEAENDPSMLSLDFATATVAADEELLAAAADGDPAVVPADWHSAISESLEIPGADSSPSLRANNRRPPAEDETNASLAEVEAATSLPRGDASPEAAALPQLPTPVPNGCVVVVDQPDDLS